MSEDRKLTGKVAMVFGGSRGLGAAAARRRFELVSEGRGRSAPNAVLLARTCGRTGKNSCRGTSNKDV
jgi:NAD(P)-dependent dehydrogenase (short-subunit alcohol dehydrogenase family)